jgi:ribonuclease HII
MRRAIAKLGGHDHVLVDGRRIVGFEEHVGRYTAIVDGDAKCYSIACASVVAKVVRDRMMMKLAARYPVYGWEHNSGYSSRAHRRAIQEHGVTPHHRRSFATVQAALSGEQILFDFDSLDAVEDADFVDDAAVPLPDDGAWRGEPVPIGA